MTAAACPDPGRLAAAASNQDATALAHAHACDRCGPMVAELAATAAALAALPAPELSAERRAAIANGVIVAADAGALRTRRRWPIGVALAAAAVAALALGIASSPAPAPAPAPAPPIAVTPIPPAPAPAPAPAPTPAPDHAPIIAPVGHSDHSLADDHTLVLRDGTVAIDTRASAPVAITFANRTRITVDSSRVEVSARRGALVAVHVFAGSAEIASPAGQRTEVVAGEIWQAPTEAPRPAVAVSEVEWFRRGWIALRAGDHAAAVAAFDRATDPAVAEDAAFWGAVARERAGETADAQARFTRFLDRFPDSARADAARGHLAALAP